jgi:hypothetical protein
MEYQLLQTQQSPEEALQTSQGQVLHFMASDCDLAEQIVQQASLAKMSLYRAHSLFERSDGGKPLPAKLDRASPSLRMTSRSGKC